MRNLITRFHDAKKEVIPWSVQADIWNYLQKYKVGNVHLYSHIAFPKCQSLVADCWKNRKKVRNLNIARETGLAGPVGRPYEGANKKKLKQEAAMLNAPLVAPHRLL